MNFVEILQKQFVAIANERTPTFGDIHYLMAVISAQAKHIERLQAKLPPMRDAFPRAPREG